MKKGLGMSLLLEGSSIAEEACEFRKKSAKRFRKQARKKSRQASVRKCRARI